MAPQFETIKSFEDVPITADGVETVSFLDAAEGLVSLFATSYLQTDIRLTTATVRARYNAHQSVSETLEKLVQAEADERYEKRYGTIALIRLVRCLMLMCRALQNSLEDPSIELSTCFKRSYDIVARHHHSFIIRLGCFIALHFQTRRDVFFARIAEGGSVEKLEMEMAKWLTALDALVIRLAAFLKDGNFGRV